MANDIVYVVKTPKGYLKMKNDKSLDFIQVKDLQRASYWIRKSNLNSWLYGINRDYPKNEIIECETILKIKE